MKIVQRHPWDISPAEAIAIQQQLRGEVVMENRLGPVRHVAGVDVGFEEGGRITRAAVAVLGFPSLELVDHAIFLTPTRFPYVPGLLSFREIPAVIGALEKLTVTPDLLLCDGQGIAHPRRFGIASHLGLLCGIPSIGVAKTRLIGEPVEPPDQRGAFVPLLDHGETIGAILRSRPGVKPLYISIGHCISLATALDYVMACVTRYRLPETTRWAHRLASGPAVE
ncbi:MAG: endonuclease V [Betaproteobacteria bacterium CG2_30_59_46]|nr:MAG: endonuclease V [Betaproteobacteria bacterium CG2_30_59_46]PIQ13829.1 MAG: deoxyribonuclease V [Hydrogenophilales bacterium CG18_big_fil_WC_8_21_14_2_50_58_12]PIX98578.1 MAG: deoxyribonuclease V [Hydrogenophilales bacterium CG_4_10_14_3_um_filter_58_23]PJB05784.1 MAG: deoxyribonuclease V [Hydrogenophilales bacterium CG_4_9_14_3_um_filter_59_35]